MDDTLIANLENTTAVQNYMYKQTSYNNNLTPYGAAQQISNAYMSLKQRVPMTIEYYQSKGNVVSVEMYINPSRMSVSTQKLKYKAVTRGGIFYHHWGDDHWTMQLDGTVGYAGMKGIYQLEKIYHHSGALLRYQNLGPDNVGSNSMLGDSVGGIVSNVLDAITGSSSGSSNGFGAINSVVNNFSSNIGNNLAGATELSGTVFKNMDLSNPYETTSKIFQASDLNQEKLSTIVNTMAGQVSNLGDNITKCGLNAVSASQLGDLKVGKAICENLSSVYDVSQVKTNIDSAYSELANFASVSQSNGIYLSRSDLMAKASTIADKLLPSLSSDIKSRLISEIVTNVTVGYDAENNDYVSMIRNGFMGSNNSEFSVLNSIAGGAASYAVNSLTGTTNGYNDLSNVYNSIGSMKSSELQGVVTDIQNSNESRKVTRSSTMSGWRDIADELNDEWRPRQLWIYFEDRVYIGHCDSFNWVRDAQSNLINYSLKLTIFRQVITNSNSSSNSLVDSISNTVSSLFDSGLSTNAINGIVNTATHSTQDIAQAVNGVLPTTSAIASTASATSAIASTVSANRRGGATLW